MSKPKVIIVGAGFAGVKCAKTLRKLFSRDNMDVVVFSAENYMVFHPLLAEVAAAVIQPRDVAVPIRHLLPDVECRVEEIVGIDLEKNQIEYLNDDGRRRKMGYDQLVIAHGNTVNLAAIPGMADHALPLKTAGDAINLQMHVIEQLEKAELCEDPERKRWYLSVVVVGGGFSGVEVAGELNELLKYSAHFYKCIKKEEVNVTLVHSHDHILPEVSPSLREFARKEMERDGVKILLNSKAAYCTREGVGLKDGTVLKAGTVVCTIGTRPLALLDQLPVPKNHGRIVAEPDMGLPGYPNAWAIGDCAAIVNANDGNLSPGTGQFAERQGAQVAHNIYNRLNGIATKPFNHRSLGSLCSIGGKKAVAEMFGFKLSGFIAWFCWRGVYLLKLPTLAQRVKVGIEWMLDLVFPREMSYLKSDPSNKVGNAHFVAGDYIFRAGDPASDFYVIEQGEVEVLKPNGDDGHETLAVLGPKDFFGESALVDNRPRNNSCRAKTDVEVLVLGRNIFTQMSSSLAPLKAAIADAIKKRTAIWEQMPEVKEAMEMLPLQDFVEPIGSELFKLDDVMIDVVERINRDRLEACYVVNAEQELIGIITRSDLVRGLELTAALPDEDRDKVTIKDMLGLQPVALTRADTTLRAISIMRERGFKSLPVVESEQSPVLVGHVRIENIFDGVIQYLLKATPSVASKS